MQGSRMSWLLAAIFSWVFSYIPSLWDAGMFSIAGLFFSALGAIFGIWLGFKLTH